MYFSLYFNKNTKNVEVFKIVWYNISVYVCEHLCFSEKRRQVMNKKIWISIIAVLALLTFMLVSCKNSNSDDKIKEKNVYSNYPEYTEIFLDKTTSEMSEDENIYDIEITEIYSNCFFAEYIVPLPYTIKLNGTLSDDWCVGDHVSCVCENVYEDHEKHLIEADFILIEASTFELEEGVCYKPVIYLYPEEATDVSVNLEVNGGLTCTYPTYNNGWSVKAYPDGTLVDESGKEYNYLYWEGETYINYDFANGFCVKGEDTAEFLEEALEKLGLNRRDANEFIVYWLPLMQENEYNIISFQTKAYTDAARLCVVPEPDTTMRVFMAYKASDEYVEIESQELTAPKREGFTVIEWGGTQVK